MAGVATYTYLAQSGQGGITGLFSFNLPAPNDTAALAVVTALQLNTVAALEGLMCTYFVTPQPTAPTPGTVPLLASCARLQFASTGRGQATILLPMPNTAVYLPDGKTVNPAAIGGLVTAVLANCCTADGTALSSLTAGRRASYPLPLWPQHP